MVKRTRRNLSDPRIKKIIQTQLGKIYHSSKQKLPPGRGNPFTNFLILILLLVVATSAILIYLNWSEIEKLWASPRSSVTAEQPARGTQTSPPVETKTGPQPLPEEKPPAPDPLPEPVERGIQTEVLNGCGKTGIAKLATDFLRQNNIDVVSQGNYRNFNVAKSFVIDRSGERDRAQKVARLLGISTDQIRLQKDNTLQLDVTVVLGADYRSLKPFNR